MGNMKKVIQFLERQSFLKFDTFFQCLLTAIMAGIEKSCTHLARKNKQNKL